MESEPPPHNSARSSSPTQAKRPADLPSPPPQIKSEPSVTTERGATPNRPSQQPPEHTPPGDGIDPETLKVIEAMKNEHSLRGVKPKSKLEPIVTVTEPEPAPTPAPAPKKRPAPKTTAATKKGVAKKAPPSKKRKVESEPTNAASPTSAVRPSPTPSKTSKATAATKGAKTSKSNTPALGSSPPAEEAPEDDVEDDAASQGSDDDVFCICRKGDNHTWMIACDGGCEDWFHGKCVKMREEDGDLIDKYICPNCEARGRGVTTWKPMCRLEGCRKPARVSKTDASKYCSNECGEKFMRLMIEKSNSAEAERKMKAKNRRKANRTDNYENSLEGDDDEDLGPRGGALRTGEIKALATGVPDLNSFRRLGDGVLTPPATTSPTASSFPDTAKLPNGDIDESGEKFPLSYSLQPAETYRIQEIAENKDALRTRKGLLKDRATFVTMTKEQVVRYAERESLKPKDVCGFDSRLSWSDEEFSRWRDTKAGQTAISLQTLEPAESENGAAEVDGEDVEKPQTNGETKSDEDKMDIDGETASGKKLEKDSFCAKKRCERHKQWQKVALQTVRFDEMELADQMRALEREEREIRERAMLRWRREVGGRGEENTIEMIG
jgi:COMPASS component SPP1